MARHNTTLSTTNAKIEQSVLWRLSHIILPIAFALHFTIAAIVVLIYSLGLQRPIPQEGAVGLTVLFGIILCAWFGCSVWLRNSQSVVRDEENTSITVCELDGSPCHQPATTHTQRANHTSPVRPSDGASSSTAINHMVSPHPHRGPNNLHIINAAVETSKLTHLPKDKLHDATEAKNTQDDSEKEDSRSPTHSLHGGGHPKRRHQNQTSSNHIKNPQGCSISKDIQLPSGKYGRESFLSTILWKGTDDGVREVAKSPLPKPARPDTPFNNQNVTETYEIPQPVVPKIFPYFVQAPIAEVSDEESSGAGDNGRTTRRTSATFEEMNVPRNILGH